MLRLDLTPTMLGVMVGVLMSVALARAIEVMLYAVVIGVMAVTRWSVPVAGTPGCSRRSGGHAEAE